MRKKNADVANFNRHSICIYSALTNLSLSFCVAKETNTSVSNANVNDMIAGLSNKWGAFAESRPYTAYIEGDVKIIPNAAIIPTTIDHAIPFAVVFFQNKSMRIAGKFADAATANAHPTRNDTFTPLNEIPKIIANIPTTNAAHLPALTFPLSLRFLPKYRSTRSWAMAPEDATIKPLTVPKMVAKAMAEIIENSPTPML